MNLDLRHVAQAQRLVVVEVRLFDTSFVERDGAIKCSAETKSDATLHLRSDDVRVDGNTAINRANHAFDFQGVSLETDLSDLRDVRADPFMHGNPAIVSGTRRPTPAGFFGHKSEHAGG